MPTRDIDAIKYDKFYTHIIGSAFTILATIITGITVILSILDITENNKFGGYVIGSMISIYAICMTIMIVCWVKKIRVLREELRVAMEQTPAQQTVRVVYSPV